VPKLATLAADRRTQRPLARWSARRARAVAISLHVVRRERHPGIRPRRLPQRRVLARVRTHRIPKTTPPPTPPTTPPPPKPPTTPQPKRPHRRRNLRPHRRRNVRPHTSDNTTADTSDNTDNTDTRHNRPARAGQTGRPPARSPRRRITRGFHIKAQAEPTHCIRLMSTGKGKEEEEIGERRSGVQDHKRRSGDRRAIGRAQSRSRTNEKAEKRKKVMPGLRVSVW
jgi:hypothetical protein